MILAIDPGAHPGWAFLVGGVIVKAGTKDLPEPGEYLTVIEKPRIYPRSPVPPNDIVTLAFTAGILIHPYRGRFRTVEPVQWKGSVPKDVMTRRIKAALTPSELAIVGDDHNVIDAAGIARWAWKQGWR